MSEFVNLPPDLVALSDQAEADFLQYLDKLSNAYLGNPLLNQLSNPLTGVAGAFSVYPLTLHDLRYLAAWAVIERAKQIKDKDANS